MPLVFRKQPSGGRGEYELVGEAGGVSAVDLMDHGFIWDTPFGTKETEVALSHQGGKRRLRLTATGVHVQRQAAALAMLPRSIRDERRVSDGKPIILENRYILDVEVALISVTEGMVTVRPTTFTARSGPANDEAHRTDLDASERFARLEALWQNVDHLPESMALGVLAHRTRLFNDPVVGMAAESAVRTIINTLTEVDAPFYIPGADPLPALEFSAGLSSVVELPLPTEAPRDLPVVRSRLEAQYRLALTRGASASAFRKMVQKAYDYRCAFCGLRAPHVSGVVAKPGVDAAHILPWGHYDLDVVQNGIMLCKQHHWAFDNHVLLFSHNNGKYRVDLNPRYTAEVADDETVDELRRAVGEIPEDRLPKASLRPNPDYINKLYEGLEA